MIPFLGIRLFYLLPIEPLNVSSVINIPLKKIEFLSENSRFTTRVADSVNEDLERARSIKDTAERTGLSWSSCKRIHKRYLKKKIYFNLGQASHIAIDEFSIKKGHKYATVVVDLDTKKSYLGWQG